MPKKFSNIKKCFVPMCRSSSNLQTKKIFVKVPLEPEVRQKWFKNVNKTYSTNSSEIYHCCQDHFVSMLKFKIKFINKTYFVIFSLSLFQFESEIQLKEDTGLKIYSIKDDIIPHILNCQDEYRKEYNMLITCKDTRNSVTNTTSSQLNNGLSDININPNNGLNREIDSNDNQQIEITTNSNSDLSNLSTISSVSSTSLNISWSDISLDSDLQLLFHSQVINL